MGRVYRAVQLSLDKVVCLKVLRRELAGDPSTQALSLIHIYLRRPVRHRPCNPAKE